MFIISTISLSFKAIKPIVVTKNSVVLIKLALNVIGVY